MFTVKPEQLNKLQGIRRVFPESTGQQEHSFAALCRGAGTWSCKGRDGLPPSKNLLKCLGVRIAAVLPPVPWKCISESMTFELTRDGSEIPVVPAQHD